MAKKKKQGRPPKGEFKKITLRIYENEYPGLKEALDKLTKDSPTFNDYILNILHSHVKIQNLDTHILSVDNLFARFFENLKSENETLESELINESFKKKPILKFYLENQITNKTQQKLFYLQFLITQILAEFRFLKILIELKEYDTEKTVGYLQYVLDTQKETDINVFYKKLMEKFTSSWFSLLLEEKIISDVKEYDIDYKNVEAFFYKKYKTAKRLKSRLEKDHDFINILDKLSNRSERDIKIIEKDGKKYEINTGVEITNETYYLAFNLLFKKIFKYLGKHNINNYELLDALELELTPFVFYQMFDLKELCNYFEYLKENESDYGFFDAIQELLNLYTIIGQNIRIPNLKIIDEIDKYFISLGFLENSLKFYYDFLNKHTLGLEELKLLGFYLISLRVRDEQTLNHYRNTLGKINFPKIKEFYEYEPKLYSEVLNLISEKIEEFDENYKLIKEYEKIYTKSVQQLEPLRKRDDIIHTIIEGIIKKSFKDADLDPDLFLIKDFKNKSKKNKL